MREREQPPRLAGQLHGGLRGVAERVDLLERPAQPLARLHRAAQALAPDLQLQRIRELAPLQHARAAQIGEQILRGGAGSGQPRAARERQHAASERRVRERQLALRGEVDPVFGERSLEHGRRPGERAADDHDLLRRDAASAQREHLGGDQLRLGSLAAGLEQADRGAGVDPLGAGLEQPSLEVVESRARARLVVLVELRQLEHAVGQSPELLGRAGAREQRLAAGLVGDRHRHLNAGEAREHLECVALQRGQLVEAIEEHGLVAPARRRGAERVERAPGVQLRIDASGAVELRRIAGVQRADITRVGRPPAVAHGPRRQGLREASRRDQRTLQLRDQGAGRGGES